MSIRDALTLRPATYTLTGGMPYALRRPSALDLIEALEFSAEHPAQMQAWFVWRHLIDDQGAVFATINDVLNSDALAVVEIATNASALYSEGRD